MKKIEDAARKFSEGDPRESDLLEIGFRAGARWFAEQMTSESAARAVDRVRILRTSTQEQLAALRKEIEGE